jgi:hypothetical protein
MSGLVRTSLVSLVVAAVAFLPLQAQQKSDKAKESLKKKLLKQLGTKTDGHFLYALEEVVGNKVTAVTIEFKDNRDAAADAMAEHLAGGDKKTRRSCQLIARLEPTDAGSKLAKNHQKKLQDFVAVRLKDPVFSRDPCFSDLAPSSGKSLNEKFADGTAVRYLPLR